MNCAAVHELRGFVANDLTGALREVQAIARGTKCTQYLFSLSLNPPPDRIASEQDLLDAANMAEARLGLTGQPRAIVFHEKQGRHHAHVVWSRIDADKMRAINLPHYKVKLTALSKELYLRHGWELPKGLEDRSLRDPLNFTREEWQQALRAGRDVRELKQLFQSAWAQSDNAQSLAACLQQKGFLLAKGDRRGVVAVDYLGEVYALARYAGVKSKDIKGRFPDLHALPSVEQVKTQFHEKITARFTEFKTRQKTLHAQMRSTLDKKRIVLIEAQRAARAAQQHTQTKRAQAEHEMRQARIPKGLNWLWSAMSGELKRLKEQNQAETWKALKRDQKARDDLIFRQLQERRQLLNHQRRIQTHIKYDSRELDKEMASLLKRTDRTQETERQANRRAAPERAHECEGRIRLRSRDGPHMR